MAARTPARGTAQLVAATRAQTPFGRIIQRAVEATPHALGGAFADAEGELVDGFARMPAHDLAVMTAHYGIVLALLTAAFGTLHHGGPEFFVARHERVEVIVYAVGAGYYVMLACAQPPPIVASEAGPGTIEATLEILREAALVLREEMGC